MSKRPQEDAYGERVTAKSKPMMNLVSRYSARDASTASESSGKPCWWNVGSKSGETRGWTTVHPGHRQVCHRWLWYGLWHRRRIRNVVKIQIILAQGEWPSAKEAGPILKDATQDSNKHSLKWGMFMSSTLEASVFMWKNYIENLHSIKNTGNNLTLGAGVWRVLEVDSRTIRWDFWSVTNQLGKIFSWKQLSLVIDEEVISLSHAMVYVFSDSLSCLRKVNQNPTSNTAWEEKLSWFKDSHNTELWTQLTEGRWNSTGIFPRIHYIGACMWSPKIHEQNGRTRTIPRTNYLHVDVQWHHVVIWRQWTGMQC